MADLSDLSTGVLVKTHDGYMGLILGPAKGLDSMRQVALGNGLWADYLPEELEVFLLPGSTSPNCFSEIMDAYKRERRIP